MNLIFVYGFSIVIFFILLLSFIFTPVKTQSRLWTWSILMMLLMTVLGVSWMLEDMSLQWVLIEASTLLGSLLISMTRTKKAMDTAWKFLLINSFGLSVAFLGLIIISYGIKSSVSFNVNVIMNEIPGHQNAFVELGLWLAIFGYSAKLGLFPNHFWVSDTYAESPSQISALLASFLPIAVCIPLRHLVKMDRLIKIYWFSAADGLLVLGFITIIYSVWTLFQTEDIRRISALIGLFHSGVLAVFLWFEPADNIFFFFMCTNAAIKSVLFSSLGIFRMDAGSRDLEKIEEKGQLNKLSIIFYLIALGMAFVIPFSPIFYTDIVLLQLGVMTGKYWVFIPVFLGLVFFGIAFKKLLPVLNTKNRPFPSEFAGILNVRVALTIVLLIIAASLGLLGIYALTQGGFPNVG